MPQQTKQRHARLDVIRDTIAAELSGPTDWYTVYGLAKAGADIQHSIDEGLDDRDFPDLMPK